MKPEFHRKYPVHAQVARFSIRLQDDLETEDGVTPYSTRWWQAYSSGETNRHVAEHETFAEIGRVTHESRVSHGSPWRREEAKQVSPVWRAYFQAVQRAYKKVNK